MGARDRAGPVQFRLQQIGLRVENVDAAAAVRGRHRETERPSGAAGVHSSHTRAADEEDTEPDQADSDGLTRPERIVLWMNRARPMPSRISDGTTMRP